MYRAIVFNVANLQEFEGFKGDNGYHEVDHPTSQEAALLAVRKAIGDDVEAVDVYLAFDVIMAYDHPCGCVYLLEGEESAILLQQSRRIDPAGIDARWAEPSNERD